MPSPSHPLRSVGAAPAHPPAAPLMAGAGGAQPNTVVTPLPGSTPVDTGDNALYAGSLVGNTDQRGVIRPQGAACDIGSFALSVAA